MNIFVSALKCRDVVLGSYVRGMSLVARAHNPQFFKIDTPNQVHVTIELNCNGPAKPMQGWRQLPKSGGAKLCHIY